MYHNREEIIKMIINKDNNQDMKELENCSDYRLGSIYVITHGRELVWDKENNYLIGSVLDD